MARKGGGRAEQVRGRAGERVSARVCEGKRTCGSKPGSEQLGSVLTSTTVAWPPVAPAMVTSTGAAFRLTISMPFTSSFSYGMA